MEYNLKLASERRKFEVQSDFYTAKCKVVKLSEVKNTRSQQQNKSLHKYFTLISEQLNELGIEYIYFGLKGQEMALMYTPELVKMFMWKPIQLALFDFESTTKLNTEQMNKIIDVISKFFSDKGIVLDFPSMEALDKNNFDN